MSSSVPACKRSSSQTGLIDSIPTTSMRSLPVINQGLSWIANEFFRVTYRAWVRAFWAEVWVTHLGGLQPAWMMTSRWLCSWIAVLLVLPYLCVIAPLNSPGWQNNNIQLDIPVRSRVLAFHCCDTMTTPTLKKESISLGLTYSAGV